MTAILFRIVSLYMGLIFTISSFKILPNIDYGFENWYPFLIGIYLIIFALAYPLFDKSLKNRSVRFITKTCFNIVTIVLISFLSLILVTQSKIYKNPKDGHDVIIVLGAGLYGTKPSNILEYRLIKALSYYKNNTNAIIVVAGGQGDDEVISEAEAMKIYLMDNGVSESSIIKEDKSISTKQNFSFSKQILDMHFKTEDYSILYVTNAFHTLRSGFYAKDAGFEAEGLSCESNNFSFFANYAREYLAIGWYFIQKIVL